MFKTSFVRECPACYSEQVDNSLHFISRLTYHPSVFRQTFLGNQCQGCGHYKDVFGVRASVNAEGMGRTDFRVGCLRAKQGEADYLAPNQICGL